ncbi:MAG: response regulator [Anaeromyxobacteraceae bacterium]|nr:response regulator [Anaeromyxobacteraceae bacterium]
MVNAARATILLVDDEASVRSGLARALHDPAYQIIEADSPAAALLRLEREAVDVIISDHLMPGMTGLEFLKVVRERFPDTSRIMLTGHADMETAVRAIREGEIYRFLTKPCDQTELKVTVHLALEQLELAREHRRLLEVVSTNPELARALEEARRKPRGG